MAGLLRCADAIVQLGASRAAAAARRISVMALGGAFAVVAAMGTIGCLVAALWIFALPSFGQGGAALVAAGALFLLSLVLFALVLRFGRGRQRPRPSGHGSQIPAADIARLLRENKGAVLLAAVVAGLAAGHAHRDRSAQERVD
jgi:hypothetical protein